MGDLEITFIGRNGKIRYADGTWSRYSIENEEGFHVLRVYPEYRPLGNPIGEYNMRHVLSIQTITEVDEG